MLTVQKDASVSVADLVRVGSALIDLKSAQLQQKWNAVTIKSLLIFISNAYHQKNF